MMPPERPLEYNEVRASAEQIHSRRGFGVHAVRKKQDGQLRPSLLLIERAPHFRDPVVGERFRRDQRDSRASPDLGSQRREIVHRRHFEPHLPQDARDEHRIVTGWSDDENAFCARTMSDLRSTFFLVITFVTR